MSIVTTLPAGLSAALRKILETAIEFGGADFGNMQILDPQGHLRIFVQQGFSDEWIDFWETVSLGQGACGTSIALGERVIVDDVERSPIFAGTAALAVQRQAGVRAVQSTPVRGREGRVIGMLSTHYRVPHRPSAKTEVLFDLLAAHAATLIEGGGVTAALPPPDSRFRTVVEDQTEVISRVLPDGTFSFVNAAYCRLFGKSANELIGQRWQPVVFPGDLPMIESRLREMLPDHPVVPIENRVFAAGGALRWMQFVNRGFFDAAGHLVEIQSVGRDITPLKQAEIALNESKGLLELALSSAGLGIWDTDIVSRKSTYDRRYCAMIGYEVDEFDPTMDAWLGRIHPEDRGAVDEAIQAHLAGETELFELEYRMRHKHGHWVWVQARGKVAFDAAGNPSRATGIHQDISQRKRLSIEGGSLLKQVAALISGLNGSNGLVETPSASLRDKSRLSARNREILQLIAEGMTSAQMAKELSISESTAKTHRRNLMRKLGLSNKAELIRYALKHGLITP